MSEAVRGRSAYALRDSGVIWKSESKKRQKLSTLDARLSTLHFGKIIFKHNRARGRVRERATEGWPEERGSGNDRVK